MAASFVLIHSPSVGPRTWQPVAHHLTELGWEATVPSLLHISNQILELTRAIHAVTAARQPRS